MKLFQRPPMNHTPHILAAVFLCGLWLPIWLIMAATYNPPWRCSFCGFTDNISYLSDPYKRERDRVYFTQQAAARQQKQIERQIEVERKRGAGESDIGMFIADNKIALTTVGIAAGVVSLVIITATFNATRQTQQPAALVTQTQQTADLLNRRTFATSEQTKYATELRNLLISATGENAELLYINSPSVTDKFVENYKSTTLARAKTVGFKTVKITDGKRDWTFTP